MSTILCRLPPRLVSPRPALLTRRYNTLFTSPDGGSSLKVVERSISSNSFSSTSTSMNTSTRSNELSRQPKLKPFSSSLPLSILRASSWYPSPQLARLFSSSASRGYQGNQQFYRKLVKDYGADYSSLSLDSAILIETLRAMQSLRSLKPNGSNSGEYKAGIRAISQLLGEGGVAGKPRVTVGEIETVLSLENGVVWRQIRELFEYGLSSELESLTADQKAMVRLNRVHGFGRIKADGYIQAGARTFEDLLNSTDKEFGRKVSDAQKLALMHHDDMELMITRSEVSRFEALIRDALNKADSEFGFEIMGSYRRGEVISSDIDVVIWHPSLKVRDMEKTKKGIKPDGLMGKVKQAFEAAGLLNDEKMFSGGEKKVLALTRLPSSSIVDSPSTSTSDKIATVQPAARRVWRQIDIRLCPLQSLPYMLLGNSGDDVLMKILRCRAMEKGWVLNEYAMGERVPDVMPPRIKEGGEIHVSSSEEIFKLLEVPYIPPTERSYHQYKNKMRQDSRLKSAPNDLFEE